MRAVFAAPLMLLCLSADRPPVLRAETWIAPAARLLALSTRPRECLAPAGSADEAARIAIGRAAFRDPLLLGGQAARSQISCATCHPAGRRNGDFHLTDLSDAPGTADVTSSIFSSHRGNGVFDPVPIPDLAQPGKIARDPASGALERFVTGLIVEEFDGHAPPPRVFAGLMAYLRAVRACVPDAREPITLDAAIGDTERAMQAGGAALAIGDRDASRFLVGAARMMLSEIDERYAPKPLADDRARVADLARQLGALQAMIEQGGAVGDFAEWRFPLVLAARLRRDAGRSYYTRAVLARALAH